MIGAPQDYRKVLEEINKYYQYRKGKHVCIKFWLGKKYLGQGYVREGSSSADRVDCARRRGILFFDGISFPGRGKGEVLRVTIEGESNIHFPDKSVKGAVRRINNLPEFWNY